MSNIGHSYGYSQCSTICNFSRDTNNLFECFVFFRRWGQYTIRKHSKRDLWLWLARISAQSAKAHSNDTDRCWKTSLHTRIYERSMHTRIHQKGDLLNCSMICRLNFHALRGFNACIWFDGFHLISIDNECCSQLFFGATRIRINQYINSHIFIFFLSGNFFFF